MADIKTLSTEIEPKLFTNIDSLDFIVSKPIEFEFTTQAGSQSGLMITGHSEFSEPEALEKLEYYEVSNGVWVEFNGDFGSSVGFPLGDSTSRFRATFKKVGTYTFTAYITSVESGERVAECLATATVRGEDSLVTTNIGELDFVVGVPTEFTYSTIAGSNIGLMVKGTSEFSEPEALEKLEYYEIKNDTWYDLNGDFGSSVGFPLNDATSRFRATFKKEGTFPFTSFVKAINNGAIIASCETEAKVRSYEEVEINSTFSSSEVKVEHPYVFSVSLVPHDDKGKKLKAILSFSTENYKLEKLKTRTYVSFDGELDDVLSSENYKFRVTFEKEEKVTMSFTLYEDDEIYKSFEQQIEVLPLTLPQATIEKELYTSEEHKPLEIKISVNSNDYLDKQGNFLYEFSTIDDIKSLEIYKEGTWSKIDRENYNLPLSAPIKTEEIKVRVVYYNDGNYDFSFFINSEKLASTKIEIFDATEVTEVSSLTNEAMKGKQIKDIITIYGLENGWTQEEIKSIISTYRNDFGKFAFDYGFVGSEEEGKLLNYTAHYQLLDSVIKLGIIDLNKTRGEIKDLILSTKNGLDEVLETLNTNHLG